MKVRPDIAILTMPSGSPRKSLQKTSFLNDLIFFVEVRYKLFLSRFTNYGLHVKKNSLPISVVSPLIFQINCRFNLIITALITDDHRLFINRFKAMLEKTARINVVEEAMIGREISNRLLRLQINHVFASSSTLFYTRVSQPKTY